VRGGKYINEFAARIAATGAGARQPSYYFSAAGSDANDGRTLATPKQTIAAANALTLTGSDFIAFRRGDTFAGALTIGQSGNALTSIIVGAYGIGAAPVIAPAATNSAVAATNQSYITVQDLTCTGADTTTVGGAAGINFQASSGTSQNILVQRCTVSGFGDNGILIAVSSTGRFDNPQVRNCTAFGNTIGTNSFTAGIQFGGNGNSATSYWPITNGLIDSCVAHDNTGKNGTVNWCGTGIKVGSCNHTYVTNCKGYSNGLLCNLPSSGASGIWMSQCNDTWLMFNESYLNTSVNADGCGFDMDGGSQNCGCLFNYSHDNTGAGFMDFSYDSATAGNSNNVIAFNISSNDAKTNNSAIVLHGSAKGITGSKIYNNTVFCKSTVVGVGCMRIEKGSGSLTAVIANNIFVSEQTNTRLITTNATNPGAGVTVAGNNYYAISTFAIEWNASTYGSVAAWQTATGQEKISGVNVSQNIEPKTYYLGSAITGDASGARLTTASGLLGTGVNLLSNFGIDPGTRDYFGGAVSSSSMSVGCSGAGSALTVGYLTGAGTQTMPSDMANFFAMELYAAGGGNDGSAACGGGAYSKITAADLTGVTLVPGVTQMQYAIGTSAASSNGGDSVWGAADLATAQALGLTKCVAAEGGKRNSGTTRGLGGSSANGVGSTKYSGGNGGTSGSVHGGGGGAAGPFGNGATGGGGGASAGQGGGGGGGANGGTTPATPASITGGSGGNGWYGLGGAAGSGSLVPGAAGSRGGGGAGSLGSGGAEPGGNGGNGIELDSTHGAGAGSGAGIGVTTPAIVGGFAGGGAGGRNAGPGGNGLGRFAYKTAGVV
jgi:hypothetical protein